MKILITGASGLLGSNLVLSALEAGHAIVATSKSRPLRHPEVKWQAADLAKPDALDQLMAETQPDGVIHCAALTDVDACEADPVLAFRVNRDAARMVATMARDRGAALIHISTDAVFDGMNGPYTEDDEARPVNTYGASKLQAERAVLDVHPRAVVLRTNFYGWSPPGRRSLAEWFLEQLRHPKQCQGFTDVQVNLALANHLADAMFRIVEAELAGTYHLSSRDSMSKFEFGTRIAAAFDLDPKLIQPVEVADSGLSAKRPKDLRLDCSKIQSELELELPTIAHGLEVMRGLEQQGYPTRLAELILHAAPVD
jgi:dTDP-4-dehydrorhamnose reductase